MRPTPRCCWTANNYLLQLRDLGLEPQVIPGEVEARLTFFGVAHDFAGERIIVADSGGGSTELATGVYAPERGAHLFKISNCCML